MSTYNQFWYWFNKERDVKKEIASREGQHAFDTNHRPLKEDSTERAFGPGSVYQADATLLDFWLASSIDRSPIGRAVLYFIVDVFSRMVVGFALNFEGPSWHGAMLALLNMQEDKVAFCKRYGRTIEAHEWPSHHFPKRLHADGGELAGVKANSLQSVGVHIRTDPAGRPDFKGIVEQKFGISNEKNRKWLKGSTPKRKQYGTKDHRLDSVYTLEEFRGVIIDLILHYNSRHEIENYKLSRGMIRDGVRAVPNELWQWGIKNRSGQLRTWPEDYVQKALLPRAKASISREGLIYKKQRYLSEMDIELSQVKATRKGRQAVTIAYDPTKTSNTIYYVLGDGKVFIPCHLGTHNAYRNAEYFEFEFHEDKKAEERAERSTKKLQDDIELEARLRQRDAEAAAKTAAAREGKSKSELLADTKEGKSHERQLERDMRHFETRDVEPYNEPTQEQEEGLERPLHKLPSPSDSK